MHQLVPDRLVGTLEIFEQVLRDLFDGIPANKRIQSIACYFYVESFRGLCRGLRVFGIRGFICFAGFGLIAAA